MNPSVCIPHNKPLNPVRSKLLQTARAAVGLKGLAFLVALGVSLPILVILASFLHPEPEIWQHIIETLLGRLLKNTLLLCGGVLAGTLFLGVGTAWLVAVCEFPGRKFFNWALMLPLAVPAYVFAFVFIGLFDFSGPVQTLLRAHVAVAANWFPNIRSAGGVILVMSLALYPYVYLLAGNAFRTQGKKVLEVSQSFGYSRSKAFFKVALPMARPWIAGGLMLVLMETLADFGAVSIFNYDTFTTAIYKAWFGFFSLSAAAQLSSLLVLIVFLVIIIEQRMRAKMQYSQVGALVIEAGRIRLEGWGKWVATGALTLIFLIAFALPCAQLLIWSLEAIPTELNSRYLGLVMRSIFLASLAAGVITALGLLLAYIRRQNSHPAIKWAIRISTMGYALPGAVLAVGIVILVGSVDRHIIWAMKEVFGITLNPIFYGTVFTVILAYTVRFLTVGYNSIHTSMHRITKNLDEASAILGITGLKLLTKIHVPLLKNGLYTAAMLIFVDVMKEMPITLMTRPFGWDTLAVKIFELTSEGEWQRAALPSIVLVSAGLIPLILLSGKLEHKTV